MPDSKHPFQSVKAERLFDWRSTRGSLRSPGTSHGFVFWDLLLQLWLILHDGDQDATEVTKCKNLHHDYFVRSFAAKRSHIRFHWLPLKKKADWNLEWHPWHRVTSRCCQRWIAFVYLQLEEVLLGQWGFCFHVERRAGLAPSPGYSSSAINQQQMPNPHQTQNVWQLQPATHLIYSEY